MEVAALFTGKYGARVAKTGTFLPNIVPPPPVLQAWFD